MERLIWDDVDANEDDATEEEEELARPNSPSFNARTRFDEVARRIIFYVLSSLSQIRVRSVVSRVLEWYKVSSPSMRNPPKLRLKVYEKRSKKRDFFVVFEAKKKKSCLRSEPRLPYYKSVVLYFARDLISFFLFFFEMSGFCFFSLVLWLFFLFRGF